MNVALPEVGIVVNESCPFASVITILVVPEVVGAVASVSSEGSLTVLSQ